LSRNQKKKAGRWFFIAYQDKGKNSLLSRIYPY